MMRSSAGGLSGRRLLGGGGSILTVPIFVYVLGFPAKQGIAMSLAVVGATSAVGVLTHWRKGHVNMRVGLVFGVLAMAGTYAGTYLARFLSGGVQLVLFGTVMLVAAAFMSRPGAGDEPDRGGTSPRAGSLTPAALTSLVPLVMLAAAIGVLTGIVGIGGGFLIVPALVFAALPMSQAVGTSLVVITLNCAIGLYGYLGQVPMTWLAVGLVTAGTVPGIALGTHFHSLVPQQALRRGFAAFLVVIASFILYQNAGTVLTALGH